MYVYFNTMKERFGFLLVTSSYLQTISKVQI